MGDSERGSLVLAESLDRTTRSPCSRESQLVEGEHCEEDSGEVEGNDDDEPEEAGEVTANSEPRPAPFDKPTKELETEVLEKARALKEYQGESKPPLVQYPTPVTLLRNWLRFSYETPSQTYYIAGSWTSYQLIAMEYDGFRYVHNLVFRKRRTEYFQIVLNGDWSCTFYPSVQNANLSMQHSVRGPDSRGR